MSGLPGALRRRLEATRAVWRPGAAHMALLPPPAVVRPRSLELPAGHLDLPFAGSELTPGLVLVRGWALFPSGPPAKVEVWFGHHPMGPARLGLLRPDVERASGLRSGLAAQFEHVADLRSWPPGERAATVRAVATSVTGERFELPGVSVRVAPAAHRDEQQPEVREPAVERPPVRPRTDDEPLRLVVFAHQLDLGGAQLLLLDLVAGLRREAGFHCSVVSPIDGPLRRSFEQLGIPVHLTAPFPLHDGGFFTSRAEELAAWIEHGRFDAALVNTTLAFPGAVAASRIRIPALWAIHESYDPEMLWWLFGPTFDPEVRRLANAALGEARRALFEADATRRQYEPYIGADRCTTLPYGMDFQAIDAARRSFDRTAARRKRRVPEDAQVVLCVGTVEPRKAQVPLAHAFSLIADRHPRARLVFVGGRDDEHTRLLEGFVATLPARGRISVHPVSPDIWPWYGLADLLVSASDVESLPRSVLEAMAWETPVLATDVFGLPELIEHGVNGWLCPPRDVRALANALDAALSTPDEERIRVGVAGRELVQGRHALAPYVAACARLIAEVAAGSPVAVAGARAG